MKKRILFMLIAILLACSAHDAFAWRKGSSFGYRSYKGAKAIDGDTYRYRGQRYRIQQYNAPELGQPGSRKATRDLQRKLNSGDFQWKPVTKDAYGRTIVNEKEK